GICRAAVDEAVRSNSDQSEAGHAIGFGSEQRGGDAKQGVGQLGRVWQAARAGAAAKIGSFELQSDRPDQPRRAAVAAALAEGRRSRKSTAIAAQRRHGSSSGRHSQAAPRTPLEAPWTGASRRVL